MSSSSGLNHHVLGRPKCLFPVDFNSNAFLSILVLSIVFTWPNYCTRFSSDSLNKETGKVNPLSDVREVLGLNLGWNSGYPYTFFMVFLKTSKEIPL
jgi:hypothetical protein